MISLILFVRPRPNKLLWRAAFKRLQRSVPAVIGDVVDHAKVKDEGGA
ncbi:MAG: hypothetical protein V3U60_00760 [Gammaproteobacteria bacterium]